MKDKIQEKIRLLIEKTAEEALVRQGRKIPCIMSEVARLTSEIREATSNALGTDSLLILFPGCVLAFEPENVNKETVPPNTRISPRINVCTRFAPGPRYEYSLDGVYPLGFFREFDLYAASQLSAGIPYTLIARFGPGSDYISHNLALLDEPIDTHPAAIIEAFSRYKEVFRLFNPEITFSPYPQP